MDLLWLLDTADYSTNAYLAGGCDALEQCIRYTHRDRYSYEEVTDSRFDNRDLSKMHANSLLYLSIWCRKPTTSWKEKTFHYLAGHLKPVAALTDIVVNISLLAGKTALTVYNRSIFEGQLPTYELAYVVHSVVMTIMFACLLPVHFFVPQHDFLDMTGWFYNVSYVGDDYQSKNDSILDPGRVKYLREKCGWSDITDEILRKEVRDYQSLKAYGGTTEGCVVYFEDRSLHKLCIMTGWAVKNKYDVWVVREDKNFSVEELSWDGRRKCPSMYVFHY